MCRVERDRNDVTQDRATETSSVRQTYDRLHFVFSLLHDDESHVISKSRIIHGPERKTSTYEELRGSHCIVCKRHRRRFFASRTLFVPFGRFQHEERRYTECELNRRTPMMASRHLWFCQRDCTVKCPRVKRNFTAWVTRFSLFYDSDLGLSEIFHLKFKIKTRVRSNLLGL